METPPPRKIVVHTPQKTRLLLLRPACSSNSSRTRETGGSRNRPDLTDADRARFRICFVLFCFASLRFAFAFVASYERKECVMCGILYRHHQRPGLETSCARRETRKVSTWHFLGCVRGDGTRPPEPARLHGYYATSGQASGRHRRHLALLPPYVPPFGDFHQPRVLEEHRV